MIRINVTGTSGSCSGNTPGSSGCPSGMITLKDGTNPLDGGMFALNVSGYTEDQRETLTIGSHALSAAYSGDNSFSAPTSAATDTIMVTQATTTSTVAANTSTVSSGGSITLTATVSTQSFSAAPTGTIAFFNGASQLGGSVVVAGRVDPNTGFAQATASLTTKLSDLPAPVGVSQRAPKQLRRHVWFVACLAVVLLLRFIATSKKRRVYAYTALPFALLLAGGIASCGGGGGTGGGGGGGQHTDSITAIYSGDTNYKASSSSAVMVTVQ